MGEARKIATVKDEISYMLGELRLQANVLHRACLGFEKMFRESLEKNFDEDGTILADSVFDAFRYIKKEICESIQALKENTEGLDDDTDPETVDYTISLLDVLASEAVALHLNVYTSLRRTSGMLMKDRVYYSDGDGIDALQALESIHKLSGEFANRAGSTTERIRIRIDQIGAALAEAEEAEDARQDEVAVE